MAMLNDQMVHTTLHRSPMGFHDAWNNVIFSPTHLVVFKQSLETRSQQNPRFCQSAFAAQSMGGSGQLAPGRSENGHFHLGHWFLWKTLRVTNGVSYKEAPFVTTRVSILKWSSMTWMIWGTPMTSETSLTISQKILCFKNLIVRIPSGNLP